MPTPPNQYMKHTYYCRLTVEDAAVRGWCNPLHASPLGASVHMCTMLSCCLYVSMAGGRVVCRSLGRRLPTLCTLTTKLGLVSGQTRSSDALYKLLPWSLSTFYCDPPRSISDVCTLHECAVRQ